jgi:sugar phosphate isomerase/epimerase
MKLGLNGMTLSETDDLESILNIANGFGTKHLELWAHNCEDVGETIHQYAYKGKNLKKAKDLIAAHGINVCCVAFGCGFDPLFSKEQELFSRELARAVEVAAEMGAGIVNHYCANVLPSENIDIAYLAGYWEPAIKRAEELNIILALENEAHDVTQTPENMLQIITAFNSSCFKTNFDPTNYYQSANEPFPYSYELLKDHIAYMHIKNGCRYHPSYCKDKEWIGEPMSRDYSGTDFYYTQTKSGAVNMDGVLNRLREDGYDGYCTLEPHTSRQNALDCIKNDLAYLSKSNYFEQN